MPALRLSYIAHSTGASIYALPHPEAKIKAFITDTRTLYPAKDALFFALQGRRNGMDFIADACRKGVRNFVLPYAPSSLPENANILVHAQPLEVLQTLARLYRATFSVPIIGIAGSRGKTSIKERLAQLLRDDFYVMKSPHNFNSQIGVALSVLMMRATHNLGIFEAGVSRCGEMEKLANLLRPSIAVLTNIYPSAKNDFRNTEEALSEKIRLTEHAEQLIFSHTDSNIVAAVAQLKARRANSHRPLQTFSWAKADASIGNTLTPDLWIQTDTRGATTILHYWYEHQKGTLTLPSLPEHHIDTVAFCLSVLAVLSLPLARIQTFFPADAYMERIIGIQGNNLLHSTYMYDLEGMKASLLQWHHNGEKPAKTLILSDFPRMGKEELTELTQLLPYLSIRRCIGIGKYLHAHRAVLQAPIPYAYTTYPDADTFIREENPQTWQNENILLQNDTGVCSFQKIIHLFKETPTQTRLAVHLGAIQDNWQFFQKRLLARTKIMLMVKSDAYGSKITSLPHFPLLHTADYLGVAFISEGIALRKKGITTPVMVMNPDALYYEDMIACELAPEIFNLSGLHALCALLKEKNITHYPIHLKLDTGMHRLGFSREALPSLIAALRALHPYIRVDSILSHLIGSETAAFDAYTQRQAEELLHLSDTLSAALGYAPLRHIANTQAILRHPHLQMDMVRLGIGLYGIDMSGKEKGLKNALSFETTVAQLKILPRQERIGYNAQGTLDRDSLIATLRVGYADGYLRALGNRCGAVWIKGRRAPVIGNICMDMMMVDVSDITDIKEGERVVLFGEELPITEVAGKAGTIPYELITRIAERVARTYIYA